MEMPPWTASPWDRISPWDKKWKELKFVSLAYTRPPFTPFMSAAQALCREREESDKEKLDLGGDKDRNEMKAEVPHHINSGCL